MPPLVSVLMTAYNREKYIGAAIESVLGQTLDDFELVIVDDRSVDRTADLARDYALRDSRIRVVVNDSNLGDYPNRNHAASLARGRFFKYHDSDDVMYPHCLATMVAPLMAEPRAGFALSTAWAWPGGPCPMLLTPRMCYQREFLSRQGLFTCGPACALFRTEVFRALGGFPQKGVQSDLLFWLRACTRENVLLLPGDLFWYRIHSGQEMRSSSAKFDSARCMGDVWSALCAPACPLDPQEREQAKRNWAFIVARVTWRDLRAWRWHLARFRLRHTGLRWTDWLRYARPPRRAILAGTPLAENGEYLIPDWSNYQAPPTPRSVRVP